jgi:CRP/FNR family cyclic AMP-dependent transcriptional regulator
MPAVSDPRSLATIPLFRDLAPEALARLNELLHRATFPPDTNIMTAGQPGEVAYLILAGTLKIQVERADGRDVIVALRGPGEIVGELSLLDNVPRTASVITLEASTLLWIDRASFQDCLRTIPGMSMNLVHILARRLRVSTTQVQLLTTQDIFGRVAHLLLTLAQEYGEPDEHGALCIPLRLTQSDLASLAGASRARVNQVLAFYRQRGYISIDNAFHITVHDTAALAHRCA